MKNYLFYIGIDISKLKLDINLLNSKNHNSEHFVIDNQPKAIKSFIKLLIKRKIDIAEVLFCCENTGVYTNHLINTLLQLEYDLWVVPAIEIKRSKGISRGKNDQTDAKDISLYSFRNLDKTKLFTLEENDLQKLKLLHAEREKTLKALLLLEATNENKNFISKDILSEVLTINKVLINDIKKPLKKLKTE